MSQTLTKAKQKLCVLRVPFLYKQERIDYSPYLSPYWIWRPAILSQFTTKKCKWKLEAMNCKAKNVRQIRQILNTIVLVIVWLCFFSLSKSHICHVCTMCIQKVCRIFHVFKFEILCQSFHSFLMFDHLILEGRRQNCN